MSSAPPQSPPSKKRMSEARYAGAIPRRPAILCYTGTMLAFFSSKRNSIYTNILELLNFGIIHMYIKWSTYIKDFPRLLNHSEWKDLELKMVEVDESVWMPSWRFCASIISTRDAPSVAAVRRHALSAFCVDAERHQELFRIHERDAPPSTKYTAYENTRRAKSNVANGRNRAKKTQNDSEDSEDKQEQEGCLEKAQATIRAAADAGDSDDDMLANMLLGYLHDIEGRVELPREGKQLGEVDWDSLELDPFE
ncbi:hypothetical protein B0H14DRAFT_2590055 [Mycena olivaceomarginata]|nr:hypothetical protein B0H14DRAFT_2590055 [Mycena olivaceomarginata]